MTSPLVAEALRLNARYVEEVVLGWNLCPWAARAWQEEAVERRVFPDPGVDLGAITAFVDGLGIRQTCAIGLAIFPRVEIPVGAWERVAEQVRRVQRGFLVAAFHPDYRSGGGAAVNAAQLVAVIRRTPDPTLQLVRASMVDDLARDGRDLSTDIARANFETVTARDPAALDRLLADIRSDRERTYARLAAGS